MTAQRTIADEVLAHLRRYPNILESPELTADMKIGWMLAAMTVDPAAKIPGYLTIAQLVPLFQQAFREMAADSVPNTNRDATNASVK